MAQAFDAPTLPASGGVRYTRTQMRVGAFAKYVGAEAKLTIIAAGSSSLDIDCGDRARAD
jgi:hypothetical protein